MARKSRKQGVMSEALKYELAKEMGVYDTVAREGWGEVPSRDCGNLTKLAIEKAEQMMRDEGRF